MASSEKRAKDSVLSIGEYSRLEKNQSCRKMGAGGKALFLDSFSPCCLSGTLRDIKSLPGVYSL